MDQDASFDKFLKDIDDHFVHVVGDLLGWKVQERPDFRVGAGSVVLRFRTQQGLFIFRVPQFSQEQLRRIALAYLHFGASGLMPEKIYHDGKCVLERYVPGVPLSARADDASLAALGRQLALLHALPASGFGPLSHGTTALFADVAEWLAQAPSPSPDIDDEAGHVEELDDDARAALQALYAEVAAPPAALLQAPCRVGHGDLWRSNIVMGADGGVTFIDWDRIGAYPREHDFVYLSDAELEPRQRDVVLQAYGHPLDRGLVHWFALRRLLGNRRMLARDKLAAARREAAWREAMPTGPMP